MTNQSRSAAPALGRPLCRRYALAFFHSVVVRLQDAHGVRERLAHWAFGWLDAEECEFLGAWTGVPEGLPRMLADLRHRGVARIRTVAAGADGEPTSLGLCVALSDTTLYPFIDELLVGTRGAARSRVPPSAERVAERVRASLARAIRRHGAFESEAGVLDFMAGALQRVERRLDRERSLAKAAPRPDPGARMPPPGI